MLATSKSQLAARAGEPVSAIPWWRRSTDRSAETFRYARRDRAPEMLTSRKYSAKRSGRNRKRKTGSVKSTVTKLRLKLTSGRERRRAVCSEQPMFPPYRAVRQSLERVAATATEA